MPKYNLIIPTNKNLSLEAMGILATMVNNPDDDYCTDEELHRSLKSDTLDTIHSALKELIAKEYVYQLDGCVYAVNKLKLFQMKLI